MPCTGQEAKVIWATFLPSTDRHGWEGAAATQTPLYSARQWTERKNEHGHYLPQLATSHGPELH